MGFGPKPSRINVTAFLTSPEVQAQMEANAALWKAGIDQMESDVERAELLIAVGQPVLNGLVALGDKVQPGLGTALNSIINSIKAASSNA